MGAPARARRRIAEAARPLLERGSPSVEAIAAAAGVSRATFYRAYPSRGALLKELDLAPDPDARERVVAAALELVARTGLAGLGMEEVAERAGVSRATLYRLFGGKAALFQAVIQTYTPLEPVVGLLDRVRDRPPEEVVPALTREVARTMEDRLGVVAVLLLQVTSGAAGSELAREWALDRVAGQLAGYLAAQMSAGRLRTMHPLLALQGLIGPIFFHLATREVLVARLGLEMPLTEAVEALTATWLRAMRPEEAT